MDKALRNAIIAGIIIIALSFGYYLVVFLPKKEAMRIEQQKQEADQQKQEQEANALKEQAKIATKQKEIDDCLSKAQDNAKLSWAKLCKANAEEVSRNLAGCSSSEAFCKSLYGVPDPNPDCLLPAKYSDGAKENLKQVKEDCNKN